MTDVGCGDERAAQRERKVYFPGACLARPVVVTVVCSAGAHLIRDAGGGPDTRGRRRWQKTVEFEQKLLKEIG